MGTSTMGSDVHGDKQDKLVKLQARKKELELLLAAKNEELYKLCVQEVQLTGIMPPEAPLSPDVPRRDRLGSVRSVDRVSVGDDVRDGADNVSTRRQRTSTGDRIHDTDQNSRKILSHRLSTPSISGISTKSTHPRYLRRAETSCSNYYPSPPQERSHETFSIHASHTYPSLAGRHDTTPIENTHRSPETHSTPPYRHHTLTTDYMNKIYYNNIPEAQNVSRLREVHFSSSHPDITTHTHSNIVPVPMHPPNGMRNTPLLYQYASHLKAQNQHLSGLVHHHQTQLPPKRRNDGARRNTLQRTQTYHLTSHSDYNQHLDNMIDSLRPPMAHQHRSQTGLQDHIQERTPLERVVPNTLPIRERNSVRSFNMNVPLQVSTTEEYIEDRPVYHNPLSPLSQISGYSGNFDSVSMKFSPLSQMETKVKEKQWYETSLDSPTKPEPPLPIKSTNLKRASSVGNSTYEIMTSPNRTSVIQNSSPTTHSPQLLSPTVQLDSSKNLTVIEQGKCIPYREESKPFEMSDFYKYSTKFRQAQKNPASVNVGFNKSPMELPHLNTPDRYKHN